MCIYLFSNLFLKCIYFNQVTRKSLIYWTKKKKKKKWPFWIRLLNSHCRVSGRRRRFYDLFVIIIYYGRPNWNITETWNRLKKKKKTHDHNKISDISIVMRLRRVQRYIWSYWWLRTWIKDCSNGARGRAVPYAPSANPGRVQ